MGFLEPHFLLIPNNFKKTTKTLALNQHTYSAGLKCNYIF